MARRWHILKGNLRCETAHNVIFFDTETHAEVMPDGSERDYLSFGWMCSISRTSAGTWGVPRWKRFSTVRAFWLQLDMVVRPKSRWFIFCHNTSYDLPVVQIFERARKHGWRVESAVIEAPPTIITLTRAGVKLTFLDTLNWWRMPLAALGDRLGIPKLAMPAKTAPRAEWDTYCKRDVEVLKQTVISWMAFLQTNDLGGFATTLAGQAFRSYRHRFMPVEIVIDSDERAALIAREAYHGGRVECFKLGHQKGPVHGVDINSMFPAVMKDNYYPIKLLAIYPTQAKARWRKLVENYCIVARCEVDASAPTYPVKTSNGLCFPVGEFSASLCTPEIVLALDRGELRGMSDIVVYERAPLFNDFVEFMWSMRRKAAGEGDEVSSWLFKILMNSLYGKWGQTGQVYETQDWITDTRCMKYTLLDYDSGKVMKVRQLGGLLQVLSSEGEARDSFPAISAHVTSYARVLLWSLIEAAGLSNTLYTDTDSLYVTTRGMAGLLPYLDPGALGTLTVTGKGAWRTLHGLKDYELPGHVVRKGVRANAIQEAPNRFRQVQWSSLKGLVGQGDVTAPTRKWITKTLKREYRK